MTWQVITGDCIEVMREMDDNSVHSVVCDPPYNLAFMNHAWDSYKDFQAWCEEWGAEALRVLKPGGHLLAFGGTRTYHRLACGLEDAGFEIRESLMWCFGSGFPKSMSVGPAIDKHLGEERTERVAPKAGHENFVGRDNMKALREGTLSGDGGFKRPWMDDPDAVERAHWQFAPATPEAAEWEGWGTALKPAYEPIVLARKPLDGTVAENVLRWGTGALNIDGTRIGENAGWSYPNGRGGEGWHGRESLSRNLDRPMSATKGRWPSNLVLDEAAADMLDARAGVSVSRSGKPRSGRNGDGWGMSATGAEHNDKGGPSRFLYVAKASRAERDAGLDGFEEQRLDRNTGHTDGRQWDIPGSHSKPRRNIHSTVKPIDLMRWLVRLVAPPDGTVLDCFAGSGSTGCAAVLEGFDFVGVEQNPEYVRIAEARIKWWEENRADLPASEIVAAVKKRPEGPTLFDLEVAE